MMKPGTWWVRSESDPRWNGEGRSYAVGALVAPKEAVEHIEAKKKELDENPPDDLECGYFKD